MKAPFLVQELGLALEYLVKGQEMGREEEEV